MPDTNAILSQVLITLVIASNGLSFVGLARNAQVVRNYRKNRLREKFCPLSDRPEPLLLHHVRDDADQQRLYARPAFRGGRVGSG